MQLKKNYFLFPTTSVEWVCSARQRPPVSGPIYYNHRRGGRLFTQAFICFKQTAQLYIENLLEVASYNQESSDQAKPQY